MILIGFQKKLIALKLYILLLSLFLSGIRLFAQDTNDQLYFKHYTIEDGLSQGTVNCLIKSKDGTLWIGTDDGLNHFDGHQFIIYRNESNNSTSLSDNTVKSLAWDNQDNLWIATANGVSRYNHRTDDFTNFYDSTTDNDYSSVLVDPSRNLIWLASFRGGLKKLDLHSSRLLRVEIDNHSDIQPWALALDAQNDLLIGTLNKGVLRYRPEQNLLTTIYDTSPAPHGSLTHNTVRTMMTTDSLLWVGTEGGGLNRINLTTNKITSFSTKNNSLSNDFIWSLAMDNEGKLWVGTDGGGLIILDEKKRTFTSHIKSELRPEGISSNTIRCIDFSENGNAWLGTYYGGLNYFNQASRNFKHYAKSFSVSLLQPRADGQLYVGTDGSGLHQFDPVSNTMNEIHGVTFKKILALHQDKDGGLWMGTYKEGLHYKKGNKYLIFTTDKDSLVDDTIWAMGEDALGNIWLGTPRGVCWIHRKTFKIHRLKDVKGLEENPASKWVRSLLVDSHGVVWLGSKGHLTMLNPQSMSFKNFSNSSGPSSTISNHIIQTISQIDNDLWIGTFGGGLIRLNLETHMIAVFDETNGFPNNTIYAIEYENKNLWLSTNKGIVKFSPDKNQYQVFGTQVGILNKTFYASASAKSQTGRMYFGSDKGFVSFNPGQFEEQSQLLKVGITGVMDNTSQTKPRPLIVNNENELELDYKDSRFLGFTISAFHYLAPNEENYQYRLARLDDRWITIGTQRNIVLTNLSPGRYQLEVKAGLNGQWSDQITTLTILIRSPWWMTNYFKGSMLALIVASIFFYIKVRTQSLKKRQRELEHLVQEKNREVQAQANALQVKNLELLSRNEEITSQAEVLQQAQASLSQLNNSLEVKVESRTEELRQAYKELDTFFYRTSHDFRRPLTTFMGLAEVAKISTKDQSALDLFKKVDDTAKSLDRMIHKLQSISNLEWQQTVDITTDLQSLVSDICYLYQEELRAENIEIVMDIRTGNFNAYPPLLKIALENIVENAIRFRNVLHPKISIRSFERNDVIQIEVEDNGQGIDKEYHDKIFDMYFRASANSKGNGLGLYIARKAINKLRGQIEFTSTIDRGSIFIIKLPLINSPR